MAGTAFKRRNGLEVFAPNGSGVLTPIRDNKCTDRLTDQCLLEVARDRDGSKAVLIRFPKIGVAFPIRQASELRKWRDTFDALLDQIARPRVETL